MLSLTSVNRIDIQNPSSVESANYQEFVRVKSYRTITETSFVLHEAGGTLQYMQDLISAKEQTA